MKKRCGPELAWENTFNAVGCHRDVFPGFTESMLFVKILACFSLSSIVLGFLIATSPYLLIMIIGEDSQDGADQSSKVNGFR